MAVPTSRHLDVAALKRAHSLAAVVEASGVTLRRVGPGRLMGCCPFHEDREPSLLVDERDGHFHCFSCHAHGDALDYLRRREGLDFRRAVERLGGLPSEVRATSPTRARSVRRWDRLTLEEQVVMNTALACYRDRLWHEPRALDYLRGRGLPDWVVRTAGLGYANGHSLESFLRRHSGLPIARALGLLGPNGRERLASRIVIPELRSGQCIWMIGRCLEEAPGRPKYLALPGERPMLGQEHAAGRQQVFMVEGALDYLTALAWKLPACSPCGTFLPAERLGFLARARVVYGVFDADRAGDAAAARFGAALGGRWRPLRLPEGCDLNDLAQRDDGRDEFFGLLAAARRAGCAH